MAKTTAPNLEDYPLFYEEFDDTTPNWMFSCEGPVNNAQCENDATTQWTQIDEEDYKAGDGGVYITYRCDDHPVLDPDYKPSPL